jgi:hypothetical protein
MADEPDFPEQHPTDEVLLENLLAPVLELAGPAQEAGLTALCEEHPERAEALRERYELLRQFGLTSPSSDTPGAASVQPLEGAFGPFVIERLLGRGGMGMVYLAADTKLGRHVALKVIRPELLGSEKARERFRREVAAAARLDHPGICTVYDAGEEAGQPWLSMRYLEGESLEVQLKAARAGHHQAWATASSSAMVRARCACGGT